MNNESHEMNQAVMKKLHSHRWTSRLLTTAALVIGLLAIAAGILLSAANLNLVMPKERLLFQNFSGVAAVHGGTNSAASPEIKPSLPRDQLDMVHAQVTLVHGKELFLTAAAIVLVGLGTFLTLLLVILNRRVTLRQVNASLVQISQQIKELQERGQGPS